MPPRGRLVVALLVLALPPAAGAVLVLNGLVRDCLAGIPVCTVQPLSTFLIGTLGVAALLNTAALAWAAFFYQGKAGQPGRSRTRTLLLALSVTVILLAYAMAGLVLHFLWYPGSGG